MLNINIYGYFTGWAMASAIALATVSLTFYTGMLYERHYDTVMLIVKEVNE